VLADQRAVHTAREATRRSQTIAPYSFRLNAKLFQKSSRSSSHVCHAQTTMLTTNDTNMGTEGRRRGFSDLQSLQPKIALYKIRDPVGKETAQVGRELGKHEGDKNLYLSRTVKHSTNGRKR
jgi:hypothetical protein